MANLFVPLILGLVEGFTEFIPVSSTGHLILVGYLLGFNGSRAASFEIFIQLGAILAVVAIYRRRFYDLFRFRQPEGFKGLRGWGLLALTTLPAVVVGAAAHQAIKTRLFNPITVAVGLAVGGIAILVVEARLPATRCESLDELSWREALIVGMFQCLALWPGVSRAAATILGAMLIGVRRSTAAEYSFLAAVPALCGAALYDLWKSLPLLSASDVPFFGIGFAVAFGSAWLAVEFFVRLLGSHTLKPFGWYRLGIAAVVLALALWR